MVEIVIAVDIIDRLIVFINSDCNTSVTVCRLLAISLIAVIAGVLVFRMLFIVVIKL